jgi:hypothetical protein
MTGWGCLCTLSHDFEHIIRHRRLKSQGFHDSCVEPELEFRVRSILGFKAMAGARVILDGIEIVHMLRTQQAKYASDGQLSLANRFERLCA